MTAHLGLTCGAAGIHLGQRLDPGFAGYWTAECAEITGLVDVDRLADAIAETVRDAEALHARVDADATQTVRVDRAWRPEIVRLADPEPPPATDDRTPAGPGHWPTVRDLVAERLAEPADLAAGNLFRSTLFVAGQRVFWLVQAHHIVLDGFGYALLYQQVSRRYNGQEPQPFGRLADLVADDESYRDSTRAATDREYWLERLSGLTATTFSESTALPDSTTVAVDLPKHLLADAGPAWPHRLLALVAAALHRHTGTATPVLGLPVSGRLGTVAAKVPGMVMNIAPLPVPITLHDTVDDVTAAVADVLRKSRRHQRYRYEWLRGDLGLSAGQGRVFGPVVNIIPFAEPPVINGCDVRMHHVTAGPVDDLAVTARGPEQLTIEANPRVYSAAALESIRDELVRLAAEGGRVSPWRVIEGPPVPEVRPLPELIDRHDPDAVAIVDAATTVTYRQLRDRARAVAAGLAGRGVVPGDLVAVSLPRGADAITAMLGVLYAGAGYLPLDPDGASDRGAAILAEAAPVATIDANSWPRSIGPAGAAAAGNNGTDRPARDTAHGREAGPADRADPDPTGRGVRAPEPTGRGVRAAANRTRRSDHATGPDEPGRFGAAAAEFIDAARAAAAPGGVPWNGEDTAYVIYTSGSTGRPKGVAVPRRALDFFVASAASRYGFTAADRVLQFAPLHFDAHVEEIYVSLAVGATIVVRDDSATQSLSRFVEFVAERHVTVLDLPTAYWHELVLALAKRHLELPRSVSTLIIGGEAAAPERVAQWHAAVGDRVRLVNSYGPTEATVVCLAADLAAGEEVCLGSPLPGVRATIGPADELYIAGPGLASGYLSPASARPGTATPDPADPATPPRTVRGHDDPASSADSAAPSPFVHVDGERWYRTGDVVALTPEGRLGYRGRVDTEVKISGHRVHPGEVEAALLRHPDVREAVVIVERTPWPRLVAHVAADLDAAALREHARRQLPEAAVPASLHIRDRLPRTSTGKLDRRSLLDVAPAASTRPASDAERRVLAVFDSVLGTRTGPEADFFTVGGTSLSAVAAATRLSGEFGRDVTAADLFAHPTAAGLAGLLTGAVAAVDDGELMRADRVWHRDSVPCLPNGDDAIALTGATGFVGSHLLAALLARTDRPVRCLVRGGAARLGEAADRFGLPRPDPGRITVVDCDLSRPVLGLDAHAMSLVSDSQAIVNCAGNVSFTRGYAGLRAVNVEAVRTLLELACVGGSDFHQISTVSVGAGAPLPEDFIDAHPGLVDGYQRGKWVAEELLRQAGAQGLRVSAYRLGRVVPSATATGHNPDDFVAHLIRASRGLGVMPELAVAEPWIAADVAAECVVRAVCERSTGVWNLNGGTVALSAVWQRLGADDPGLKRMPVSRWRELLGTREDTAILKAFFDIHADGPPREHRIHSDRFEEWFAGSGLHGPAWNLDWCARVGR